MVHTARRWYIPVLGVVLLAMFSVSYARSNAAVDKKAAAEAAYNSAVAEAKVKLVNYMAAVEGLKAAGKPDWQLHLDWSIADDGHPNCPEYYAATYPECLWKGNRSCLMRHAIQSAKDNDYNNSFRLSLITQCHNPGAQLTLSNAGATAIGDYLKTK